MSGQNTNMPCSCGNYNWLCAGAVVIALLVIYNSLVLGGFIARREGMCGGCDQLCKCSGNETMMVNSDGVFTQNSLSLAGRGY